MNAPLLHMSEEKRELAARFLRAVLDTFADVREAATPDAAPPRRAFGDRSGIAAILTQGGLSLSSPPSGGRRRPAVVVEGPLARTPGSRRSGLGALPETLDRWCSLLSTPVTAATLGEAETCRAAMSVMLLAAAERLERPWSFATLRSAGAGDHAVTVADLSPRISFRSWQFASRGGETGNGRMSAHLVAELDRVVGGRTHVHVVGERRGGLRFVIGATPAYTVTRPDDPISILRALAALPHEAAFLDADPADAGSGG